MCAPTTEGAPAAGAIAPTATMKGEADRRAIVIDRMIVYTERLLRTPPSEGLRWTGTMTDLVEAAHEVWQTGRILGADGRPMAFRELLSRLCVILHRRMPSNAHALLCQTRLRKGVRSSPIVTRYEELLFRARLVNPFQMDVGYVRG